MKIVLFGASGLIGGHVLSLLQQKPSYSIIECGRKQISDPNDQSVQFYSVTPENFPIVLADVIADVVICCLGTTIKKAGSTSAFKSIDVDYVTAIGSFFKQRSTQQFHVISSLGATTETQNFYLQCKGKMESELTILNFPNLTIYRPSLLLGNRNEFRFGEKLAEILMTLLGWLMIGSLKKYRAIPAITVAKAIIYSIEHSQHPVTILESDKIEGLVR